MTQINKDALSSHTFDPRWLQYVLYGALLLYFGRDILIPLSFAALLSFVLYPVTAWLEGKGLSRLMATLLPVIFVGILGLLLVALLVSQFIAFIEEWPALQQKVNQSFHDLSVFLVDALGISVDRQKAILARMSDPSGGNLLGFLRGALSAPALPL